MRFGRSEILCQAPGRLPYRLWGTVSQPPNIIRNGRKSKEADRLFFFGKVLIVCIPFFDMLPKNRWLWNIKQSASTIFITLCSLLRVFSLIPVTVTRDIIWMLITSKNILKFKCWPLKNIVNWKGHLFYMLVNKETVLSTISLLSDELSLRRFKMSDRLSLQKLH